MKMRLPKRVLGLRIPKRLRSVSRKASRSPIRIVGAVAAPIALGLGGVVLAIARSRDAAAKPSG